MKFSDSPCIFQKYEYNITKKLQIGYSPVTSFVVFIGRRRVPMGAFRAGGSRKEVIRLSSTGKEEQQPLFSGVRLKEMAGKLRGFSKTAFRFGYRCCYVTGVRTVRVFRYTGRRLGRVLRRGPVLL